MEINGIEYLIIKRKATIIKYKGNEENIVIPSKIEGYDVVEIGNCAFKDCNIKSITIPSSVIKIGRSTFYNCDKLTNVTFEENSQLESIGYYAFYGCTSLETITLPFIGESKDDSQYLGYIFGASSYDYNYKYVPNSLKEVIILEGCTSIEGDAFYKCSSLTSIIIPRSVTSIGENAFYDCRFLLHVYYSGTIKDWCEISFSNEYSNPMIYASQFYMLDSENNNYKEVTSIEIPSTVTSIGKYQFDGFNNVTSITIPSSLTHIGYCAFYNCRSLTSITIPSSVIYIRSYAFRGCSSLINITIPNSVTSIEWGVFDDCDSLQYNEYDNGLYLGNNENPYLVLVKAKDTSITSCIINNSTKIIADNAFYYCSRLTNIIIPSNVISIGCCAFNGCDFLTIYCEVKSKPEGWNKYWNTDYNNSVVWGYKNEN